MTADLEHDQVADLLGAFALDAVDPDEHRQVERHLAECPRCRAEVDDLRRTAADLALVEGLETDAPPDVVWDRIAAGIGAGGTGTGGTGTGGTGTGGTGAGGTGTGGTGTGGTGTGGTAAGGTGAGGTGTGGTAAGGTGTGGTAAGTARPPHGDAVVVDLSTAPRRSSRHAGRRRTWIGGVAAGVAAATIAALALWGAHTEGQVHRLQAALVRRGSEVAVAAALASPGHRVVDLRSTHGARLAEIVVRHDGAGFIVRSSMSQLPATETYQLWAAIDGRPISIGLLGPRPVAGTAFSLGTAATGARELMVTVEPSGGVPTPDRTPIATAPLSVA